MAQEALAQPKALTFKPLEYQEPSPLTRFLWNFTDTVVVARRNLLYYMRLPQLLVFSSIQPIMFVLLFNYVFGGSIQTPNGNYTDYLLPGIMLQSVIFGSTATAVGLAEDLKKGMIDRFRSLPMARSAVLAGRTLADSIRNVFVVCLMIAVGYIIGFRFHDGVLSAIFAVAVIIAFGHAFSWISALIGIMTKDPETAQVAGFVWIFPLVFASSAFVPTATMPSGLRAFAENQPITQVVNTARALVLGQPVEDYLFKTVVWIIVLMVIFVPLAIRQYRRAV